MNVYTLILKSGESVVLTLEPVDARTLDFRIGAEKGAPSDWFVVDEARIRVSEIAAVLKGEEVVEDERAPDPPFLTVDNSGPGMIP